MHVQWCLHGQPCILCCKFWLLEMCTGCLLAPGYVLVATVGQLGSAGAQLLVQVCNAPSQHTWPKKRSRIQHAAVCQSHPSRCAQSTTALHHCPLNLILLSPNTLPLFSYSPSPAHTAPSASMGLHASASNCYAVHVF